LASARFRVFVCAYGVWIAGPLESTRFARLMTLYMVPQYDWTRHVLASQSSRSGQYVPAFGSRLSARVMSEASSSDVHWLCPSSPRSAL